MATTENYQSNGLTYVDQRWVGTARGVGNRKSRKLELAQKPELEIGNQNFFGNRKEKTPEIGILTYL